jgi:signal transduction histidine kinase
MNYLMWLLTAASAAALVGAGSLAAQSGETGLLLWVWVGPAPFLAVAAYLLWRRPTEPVARLLVVVAAAAMALPAFLEAVVKSGEGPGGATWALLASHQALTAIGISAATVMIGLFPAGRAGTRGERLFVAAAWLIPVAMVGLLPASRHVPVSAVSFPGLDDVEHPLFVEALSWLGPVARAAAQLIGVVFVAGLALLVLRYRRTEELRRRQIRWVAYAATAALFFSAVPWVLGEMGVAPALTHGVLAVVGIIPMLLLPVSIAIGIEQPSWIDTDAVIRRSAAFGLLSAFVLVLYVALAAGFGVAAGRRLPVELAIVITVVVAVAFHPARVRLQRGVDRWVYGDQPTRFDAVAGFGRAIHDTTDPADIVAGLADTVRRALRLRWVEVEIPPEPPHVSGSLSGEPVTVVPIRHRDETLGSIRCGPSVTGRLRAGDAELVSTLGHQTGLAVFNGRLAARVVHAQEAERRRIERNIHDGAQQELVALVAKLGLARSKTAQGILDEGVLVELQEETKSILRDLRTLAQGIHPSVLSDGGLVEAVRDRCARLPIPVTVDASPCLSGERFTDDVEGAAYFFVTEALANVLKHSAASEATVTIHHESRHLEVVVSDDGVGFDPDAVRHNGLAGLADRVAALAGTVRIDAEPGKGAAIRARLPVEADHR